MNRHAISYKPIRDDFCTPNAIPSDIGKNAGRTYIHEAGMDTGRVDPRVGSSRVGSGRNFLNALFLSVSRVK